MEEDKKSTRSGLELPEVWGVYQITNIHNGRVYIGSSTNVMVRWHEHISGLIMNRLEKYASRTNRRLIADYVSVGVTGFTFQFLETCNGLSLEQMRARETELIRAMQPYYNIKGK